MAPRKKAKAEAPKAEAPKEEAPDVKPLESPISNTGAVKVYRADLGESLPPQKPSGVE
jgi:hypothetical protein